jgi:hypothetical protein
MEAENAAASENATNRLSACALFLGVIVAPLKNALPKSWQNWGKFDAGKASDGVHFSNHQLDSCQKG